MNNDTPADAITERLGKMLSELDEVVMTDNQRAKALIDEYERHRTTSLAAQEIVDCETCCGNGEIVTDWERYKHPREGDVGDEAVAECPDCDGNGKIEVPSLAAQDGLVDALRKIAKHDSDGLPEHTPQAMAHIAAAALASIEVKSS